MNKKTLTCYLLFNSLYGSLWSVITDFSKNILIFILNFFLDSVGKLKRWTKDGLLI